MNDISFEAQRALSNATIAGANKIENRVAAALFILEQHRPIQQSTPDEQAEYINKARRHILEYDRAGIGLSVE